MRGNGTRARGSRLLAAVLAAVTLLGVASVPARAAADPSPPGANDWSCSPSRAHPRPLVLVHGLGATMNENWSYLSPRLKAAGYCVFALTYGVDPRTAAFPVVPGGVVPMERSARQFAAFVARVRAATHARKVDLVGHSEGTVMPRYYLKVLHGARRVNRFVAMTPLWRGTDAAAVAELRDALGPLGLAAPVTALVARFCGSCPEFLRGSAYLRRMNAGGEAVRGVRYTSLITRYDELVSPYTSGIMHARGARNIVVQNVCPTDVSEHLAMAFDPVVAQLIANALDPPHARAVSCGGRS